MAERREKLEVMLLLLLHAGLSVTDMSFQCDNDFMLTISCSLNLTSAHDSPHWLTFLKIYADETYKCNLSNANGGRHSCFITMKRSCDFMDFDKYKISLCGKLRDGQQWCQPLDDKYMPVEHIKPNAPCCLAVSHNSSQHHFTWKNTYEKCEHTTLTDNLDYQLCFSNLRDNDSMRVHNTDSTDYSVDDSALEADTEYSTKVRSRPSATHFEGHWSDWSQEVQWRTVLANDPPVDGFLSKHGKTVFLASGVTATLVLILCYALLNKWRQGAFVPTPAPYFQSLYTNCHGDFKSWVDTQANMTITLKPEDTLRVDSHVEETPTQDEEMAYENVISPSACLAPDEGSVPLIQGGPLRYCPEYCTISDLQQSAQGAGKVTSVDVTHTARSEHDYCNETQVRKMLSRN